MAEQQVTQGATGAPSVPAEGAEAPSRQAVAEPGQPQPSPAPTKVDLTQFEDFRAYDAKRQQKEAELLKENQRLSRERGELAARVQQAELARTQENLRAQGLDERAISQTTAPIMARLVELETDNILLRLGMSRDDMEPGDLGRNPQEFEANMRRKKNLREQEAALEEKRKALEAKERAAAQDSKVTEREQRRQSGADRQVAGDSEPPPDLRSEWEAEVAATRARGGDVAMVNRKYRGQLAKQGVTI